MKVKNYAFLAFALFILLLALENYIQKGKLQKSKEDIERLRANQFQLLTEKQQQTTLYLTTNERTTELNKTVDSLAKALKIAKKRINKLVYIDNYIHDTIPVPVPVAQGPGFWTIRDSSKCIIWEADVYLDGESIRVWRNELADNNRITETFYRERPKKFLLFKVGKFKNYQHITATCGNPVIKEFVFVK